MTNKKKAYLVKSQEAYDKLMKELEEKGYLWRDGDKLTEWKHNDFADYSDGICIYLKGEKISQSSVKSFKEDNFKDYDLIGYPETSDYPGKEWTGKYNTVKAIYDDLYQTYLAKNADYGDSFGKSVRDYGLIASLVRIGDKFNRFENLIVGGDRQMVHDETIKDTLLDLANYCVMTVAEMKEMEDEPS